MKKIGLKRNSSVYCFASIEAFYLRDSTVDRICAELSASIEDCERAGQQNFASAFVRLHNLLIEQGDVSAYRCKYGADGVDWYKAGVNLLVLAIRDTSVDYWQVGDIHCAIAQNLQLQLLPVHNVSQERKANTLAKSTLASVWDKEAAVISSYLLSDAPALAKKLAQLSPKEFWDRIGHIQTRKLGYIKDPKWPGESKYLAFEVALSSGTIPLTSDSAEVVIYFPGIKTPIPYSEGNFLEVMSALPSFGKAINFSQTETFESGDAVKIELSCSGPCLVEKCVVSHSK